MAKLHPDFYPGEWEKLPDENFDAYLSRADALFESIPKNRLVSFPYADGHAFYFVFSTKPLVLQSIPYADAWQVPDPMIRGLRLADVKQETARQVRMREIFSKKDR